MLIFNAHVHLNGSVSLGYLKETANRNQCPDNYNGYILESNLWSKFDWIHKIMQTPLDIELGTIDVVRNSKADILEIRTTPKAMENHTIEEYIQGFVKGLAQVKKEKSVRGLLSIDRARHTLVDAKWIIDAALKEKQSSGMIVGVDLSGNFLRKRMLTGNDLYLAVKYALEKDIGIALHVGEVDSPEEKQDFDLILKAIQEYKGEIMGKVRLGHAVYRSAEQDDIIRQLKIPVEICPTCHQTLDWWKKDEKHPILSLYQFRSQVLPGTDNSLLFDCNEVQEQKKLDDILTVSEEEANLTETQQQENLAAKRKRYMFFVS